MGESIDFDEQQPTQLVLVPVRGNSKGARKVWQQPVNTSKFHQGTIWVDLGLLSFFLSFVWFGFVSWRKKPRVIPVASVSEIFAKQIESIRLQVKTLCPFDVILYSPTHPFHPLSMAPGTSRWFRSEVGCSLSQLRGIALPWSSGSHWLREQHPHVSNIFCTWWFISVITSVRSRVSRIGPDGVQL